MIQQIVQRMLKRPRLQLPHRIQRQKPRTSVNVLVVRRRLARHCASQDVAQVSEEGEDDQTFFYSVVRRL